jgi:UDP-N-acetylmuramate--alanine ligase
MKHVISRIYFVGIGGAGMSGIAEVLHNLGYVVSGSDANDSAVMQHLRGLGITAHVGHRAEQVESAQVLVVSTAITATNPELIAARELGIVVVPRAGMLAELMRFKHGIAVAGTHGKTTTTSLTASILAHAGLDPTYVIGGKLTSAGVNAKLGAGEHIVVEADESDGSFLNLSPLQAIVTNIDEDHMATYDHDVAKLHSAFVDFLHRMPFYGKAIVCTDDAGVQAVLPKLQRPVLTYGLNANAMLQAVDAVAVGATMQFSVRQAGLADWSVSVNLPGLHNVRNALAAIAVAQDLGIGNNQIAQALAEFKGVGRRFQQIGMGDLPDGGQIRLIDDYGHHPVEVQATISAARGAYPNHRLVLAFQPHRYSRTRDCFEDFVAVLGSVDALLLTDVYAAGELPIVGADAKALARALRLGGHVEPLHVPNVAALPQAIAHMACSGDVVLCMGAGSVGSVALNTLQLLKQIAAK